MEPTVSAVQVPEYKWLIRVYYRSGRLAYTIGCTNDNARDFELDRIAELEDVGEVKVEKGMIRGA